MSIGKAKKAHADQIIIILFVCLVIFGLFMLTSASSVIAYNKFQDPYFFVKRQILYGLLPGIAALLFFAKIPYNALKKMGTITFGISLLLLLAVLIPGVGSTLNSGARSWLIIAGFSFQPAELAKLGLIFFMSGVLGTMGHRIKELKEGFLVALCLGMLPIFFVVLQPDIGTASILFAILFSMLFIAGARYIHLAGLAGLAVGAFILLIAVAPYRAARFTTFLHPELDPQGIGYHINQSFLAIGSGGLMGHGLGQSRQKYQYLPEVHADSIFAVIAEEMGFFFVVGFIIFLVLIAKRGLKIAQGSPDLYGQLLVAGIIVWFMIQSFFNIAAMLGLMPITGVPLPFVSHGGTSLLIALSGVGVIANISKRSSI